MEKENLPFLRKNLIKVTTIIVFFLKKIKIKKLLVLAVETIQRDVLTHSASNVTFLVSIRSPATKTRQNSNSLSNSEIPKKRTLRKSTTPILHLKTLLPGGRKNITRKIIKSHRKTPKMRRTLLETHAPQRLQK